jgi:SulP family sulfate permease
LLTSVTTSVALFTHPAIVLRTYHQADLKPDLVAGLTVAVILLPQAIAYALIAGMPPQLGLYTAILAAIAGGLWGSSNQLHTGPTNTAALLVLATLAPLAATGSPEYIAAASALALMIGIFRLLLGIARLGMLVNFVSDSVIIGFTAGAGVLIIVGQLSHILRVTIASSSSMVTTLRELAIHITETHWMSVLLTLGVAALIVIVRRFNRKLPAPLLALVLAGTLVWILDMQSYGVKVIGEVPSGLPPLTDIRRLSLDTLGQLASGALAIGAIGLVEAISVARSVASQTGQRLDSNQEFVGQGMANIAASLFSGFASSGSFSRTSANYLAGARTPLASVFSGLFVLAATLALGPLTAYIPRAALAGVLLLIAYGMIDRKEIARILRSAPGDVFIMISTFAATLLLPLQYAVLIGILSSFTIYILRTSLPRVICVVPDDHFHHLLHQPGKPLCPQLGIFKILGDLYFGAVSNIEKIIHEHLSRYPGQYFLLLSMESVNQCDISGIHFLENILRACRDRGGDLFFQRLQAPVLAMMQATGFNRQLGEDHLLSEDESLTLIYHHILDPAICIYECEQRVFLECQNLPKNILSSDHAPLHTQIPPGVLDDISPQELCQRLQSNDPPLVIDVREPREFQRGHIPQARSIPLHHLLTAETEIERDQPLVLVCQGGRRSSRACYALSQQGYQVLMLQGGMLAWENAGLLEAIG